MESPFVLSQEALDNLAGIVGGDEVIGDPEELLVYECDGCTLKREPPAAVVFPRSTDQTSRLVKYLHDNKIPFVPRGTGTGLSGGAVPVPGAVIVGMNKMDRVLEIDYRNRRAVVEPGVFNLALNNAVAGRKYLFAPDPSSQMACTIGGNIAENAGGPHTLKHGVTVNHVTGMELVLANGDVVEVGGKAEDQPGYDLTGLVIGSEGTFAICTKATLRIIRQPQTYRTLLCVFNSVDDAVKTVSGIIAAGVLPVGMEMMDRFIVRAVEEAFHFGFPLDAAGVLIVELDGLEAGLDRQADRVAEICKQNHVREIKLAATSEERLALWTSRKKAFGALGRLSPNYYTQDGVVPRTRLPDILQFISKTSEKYGVRIANVFHAGDGNVHPIMLYDERDPEQVKATIKASGEVLEECIRLGGAVTGEHGVGIEKAKYMPKMYSPEDLGVMISLKNLFDPEGVLNPHKIFPSNGSGADEEPKTLGRQASI